MIYLDNAATTRPLDGLVRLTEQYLDAWYNPSALYAPAVEAHEIVETNRRKLQKAFSLGMHKCIFTSGGTESANMVLKAGTSNRKGANIVVGGFEHPCVEESAKGKTGTEIRWARCDTHGYISVQSVLDQVDENTTLVCVMHVNNETGAQNDISGIAAAVKSRNPKALFFADGVQAFLRTETIDASKIDYYSVSGHKINALKGTGALLYLQKTPLKPYLDGGGQENGLRSGTENTLGIISLGASLDYFLENGVQLKAARKRQYGFLLHALSEIPDSILLSPPEEAHRCNHILCISFPGIRGETLMHCLEEEGIYVSTGSACSSKKGKSRMETALGIDAPVAQGAVRISLGALNTDSEIEMAAGAIQKQVERLRNIMRKH